MSEIIEERLSNGIRVVIDPGSSSGAVSVGFAFGIGSRYERPEEHGLSHFLEHNLFTGTHEESALELEKRADELGCNSNAYTNKILTNYYLTGESSNGPGMIRFLSDIITKSAFPNDLFETERDAVLEEIKKSKDDPDRTFYEHMSGLLYPNQAHGRNVIGPARNISAISRESMIKFYGENYNTGSLIVSIAGEVDPDEAMRQIEEGLKGLPEGKPRVFEPAVFAAPAYSHIPMPNMEQTRTILSYEGVHKTSSKSHALALAANILGNGSSSYLYQQLRGRGLIYSVMCPVDNDHDTGAFHIELGCSPEKLERALSLTRNTVEEFSRTITEDDLRRAKIKFNTATALSVETVNSRMNSNIYETIYYGRVVNVEEVKKAINAVTISDVKSVLKETTSTKPTMVTMGPEDASAVYDRFTLGMS